MTFHRLKTYPEYFQPVIEERKPFEIRNNDRDFKQGDCIILNEYKEGKYTGRVAIGIIKDIFDISFLLPGYVAFTFKLLNQFESFNEYHDDDAIYYKGE